MEKNKKKQMISLVTSKLVMQLFSVINCYN